MQNTLLSSSTSLGEETHVQDSSGRRRRPSSVGRRCCGADLQHHHDHCATPTAPATGLSLDTPIEQIAAVPAGKAVLDKDIPGLTTHPAYDQFKGMSLKEVQPMSQGAITDDMLAKTGADLAALPK